MTVLFADLVGFTTLSEHRDPEEVRELLSRYFDRCRTLIERYGGTVEKFIGDAVMAVWGTPVAREDDSERAVRAGLALAQAVSDLGEELDVRVGVTTGRAAVDLAAEGEGMVLGDTVNTASRLQTLAGPGRVLVDDVTRRSSEAAIAYEDAGMHAVKGREQPVHAWHALRVVAGAGGARRGVGVEAPFVGRGRELQAIIDSGERSAHDGRAEHVAIVGEAGSGKSRLLWEFFKYLDGIEEVRWWHQGRCLSYGEGVAYWALAEMVRARAGIAEEESAASAREKLRVTVEAHVPDERDRRLVEPRLAHLLRLEERPDADRADLFSGWRLFFERMAATNPVILAFEDLQWADSGLLDFIDYLLEWSADSPIFVLTFARPELLARRPAWKPLLLDPLAPDAITDLLAGLAPGLPEPIVAEIGHRAEGIPLYAVETIRMLQDRGLLVQDGDRYLVAGDISDLEVPETLHALVASRLDGLSAAERSLLQDASVLGQSFTAAAAAALAGRPETEVRALLDALVAKQVLGRDDDPRSPDRGQYVFLQGLLRTVAYGTLSRRARKTRHVEAARYLEQAWPGEAADIAEVLASHYLEAIQADPDADDVGSLRASARARLTGAGRAAASLALGPEARRYFEQAAELTEDERERAELFEQAGRALWQSQDPDAAQERLQEALALYRSNGIPSGGSAAVALATLHSLSGRLDDARSLLERFRPVDNPGVDKIVRAQALAALGNVLAAGDDPADAEALFDEALATLELEQAWAPLAEALVRRAVYLTVSYRREEATAILRHGLALAQEHDLPAVALRARMTLAGILLDTDRLLECLKEANEGLAIARERGDRRWERQLLGQEVSPLVMLGRWGEALTVGRTILRYPGDIQATISAAALAYIAVARGDEQAVAEYMSLVAGEEQSSYMDGRCAALNVSAAAALEQDAPEEALRHTGLVLETKGTAGELVAEAFAFAIEAAFAIGEVTAMSELIAVVDALPPARATPMLRSGRARLRAERAHRTGDREASERFEHDAILVLREVGFRPLLAQALLERGRRHDDREAIAEARTICEELGATRWLERLDHTTEVPAL